MDLGLDALAGAQVSAAGVALLAVGAAALGVGITARNFYAEDRERRDTEPLALEAGAVPPLEYLGIGMTGVVFRDREGLAYKVPRPGAEDSIADEADWLRTASQVPYVRDHVVRFVRLAPNGVLVREAVEGKRRGAMPKACVRPDRNTSSFSREKQVYSVAVRSKGRM
jgi:hypothetical protein